MAFGVRNAALGDQNMRLQNMPLEHKDYFELNTINKKQQTKAEQSALLCFT